MDTVPARSAYRRPFPRVVRVEPAGACNLACSHCPTGTVQMKRGIMQPKTFSLILDSIRAQGDRVNVVVLYHGGEPLVNRQFPAMVRRLKALCVPFVKTVSNGMLLRETDIHAIIESGLDAIEFSFDGQSPEENDFVRRGCDCTTVVGNIKRFIDVKRASGSATPKIFIASTQFVAKDTYAPGRRPAVPPYLAQAFSGEYAGGIAGFKCTFALKWPHMEIDETLYELFADPYDQEIRNACDHVDTTVTVRWNGDVVACCYDLTSLHVLGNVHAQSLEEIWNGEAYLRLRESIDHRQFVTLCDTCQVVKPGVYLVPRRPLPAEVRA
jgi:radical SAM protein with 4Fe4S-binding SPASM domain